MSRSPAPLARRLFDRGSWPEARYVASALRTETVGGALLLGAAVLALLWANSPWDAGYAALRDLRVGPAALHLDLTLAQWASDGLLAVFFLEILLLVEVGGTSDGDRGGQHVPLHRGLDLLVLCHRR